MNIHADKTQKKKSQSVAVEPSQMQGIGESILRFVDNQPKAVAQRKLQEIANNGQQVSQLSALQEMANNSQQAKQAAQLQAMADSHAAQQQQPIQKKENNNLQKRNTVQRKNINQAELAAADDGQRNLVSDGREVNLYVQEEASKAPSKVAAFQKAAELNGSMGKRVDDYAALTPNMGKKDKKWTKPNQNLNDDSVNKVDPFMFGTIIPFVHESKDERMELIFQHAASWTGYVEAVYDSTNKSTSGVPTMYDSGSENSDKDLSSESHYRNLKFSNVHEKTPSDNVAPNVLDLTEGEDERNFDAYTKLAGEGARWQCVRKHAANLSDHSYFYTRENAPENKVFAVPFRTLWITWAATFKKDYDIIDSIVKSKISGDGMKRRINGRPKKVKINKVDISALSAKDYNLDESKSHGT